MLRWEELDLGWAGRSKEEAQAFAALLSTAWADFFDSTDPATGGDGEGEVRQGVVSRFAQAITSAGFNYGAAEAELHRLFDEFGAGLDGGGQGEDSGFRDFDDGPITENTPT
jgi:hypothetical protein